MITLEEQTAVAETTVVDLLAGCEGYRVDSPDGRVGTVEAVLPSFGALAVAAGLFATRILLVPFSDVERVDRERRRVVLRASPQAA
jgi:hypothetical protein